MMGSVHSLYKRRESPPISQNSQLSMDIISDSVNLQTACALFTAIPPEIRNYIFRLALSPSDDIDEPYSGHSFYYRPGYQYAQVSHTELLRTCRLVYAETRLLPWSFKEHVFWCHRGPKDSLNSPERYFKALTDEQIANVRDVHIFAQSWWLEGNFPAMCLHTPMRMRSLKVTIRNSDWWYWEHNQLLSLKRNWTRNVSRIDGLEQMQLELEVIQRDRPQVWTYIARGVTITDFGLIVDGYS